MDSADSKERGDIGMILGFRTATAGVVAFLLVLACTIGFAWTAYADPAEDGQEVASQAVDAAVPAGESAQAAGLGNMSLEEVNEEISAVRNGR